jgi:hypothetical protein
MEDIRRAMAANPREFLDLIARTEEETGIPVTANLYKRPKEAPIPELAPYYAWKGNISCVAEETVSENMFGPELGYRAGEMLQKLIPLYDYFNRFKV